MHQVATRQQAATRLTNGPLSSNAWLRAVPALLAAGLLLWSGCATSGPAASEEEADPDAPRHTLWWVEGRSGTEAGGAYLLGALPALRHEDADSLPGPLRAAFEEADAVAFEVDLDDVRQQNTLMQWHGTIEREGRRLDHLLPDSTRRLLHATLDSLGLPASHFQKMKPWMAAFSLRGVTRQPPGSRPADLEGRFFEEAGRTGKERVALETIRDQLSLYRDLPPEMQSRLLHAALRDAGRSGGTLDTLTTAWKRGNAPVLDSLASRGMQRDSALRAHLLTERNRRWTTKLELLIQRVDTSLVVVGTDHLVGEGGIVELLRGKGYAVRQVRRREPRVASRE